MISEQDQTHITEAIRQAETKTSGEIFCVIARSSSTYPWVPVSWAAVIALLSPWPLLKFTDFSAEHIYLAQLVVFVLLIIALWRPAIRYRLVPRQARHDRAHRTAMRQFAAHGLHKTARRTGVLIFASQAERYAEIIADAGINEKVDPQVWDDAIAALLAGIKAGKPADGFVAAIERCGAVLAQHFPLPAGAANPHELPDRLIEI
jgi:putative membrane protein